MFDSLICSVYRMINVPADGLPYSPEFDRFVAEYRRQSGQPIAKRDLWRRICRLRKKGLLPRLQR